MPLPTLHPVTKTSREIRRSIDRLIACDSYGNDERLQQTVTMLRAAHAYLPKELIDKEL